MPYFSIISAVVGTGLKLLGSSQGPNYPSPPQIRGINIPKAQNLMEAYEAKRMQASIDAWKARFPLLYKGGQYEIGDIAKNQAGYLSDTTAKSISNAGLEMPKQGNQYKLATDIGLSPITLAQRNSQAVTRQIALNPEWTNKISGGTLATMMANNAKNQNAFSQFLGAQNTAQYVNQQNINAYNTQALVSGLLGTAQIGARVYNNQFGPLSSYGQGIYGYPQSGSTWTGGYGQTQPSGSVTVGTPYNATYNPPNNDFMNVYNNSSLMPDSYLGSFNPSGDVNLWTGSGYGVGGY